MILISYKIAFICRDRGPAEDVAPDDDFDDKNAVYFRLGAVGHSNYLDYPVNARDHHLRWREFDDYWNVENY